MNPDQKPDAKSAGEKPKKAEAKAPPLKGGFYAEEGTYYAHKKCYKNYRIYKVGDEYQASKGEKLGNYWKKSEPANV